MSEELKCQSCGAWLEIGKREGRVIRCAYCGANYKVGGKRGTEVEYSHEFTLRLYRVIDESFTLEEMKELVIELSAKLSGPYRLDYDDIAGNSQQSKARELVQWCERRCLLGELAEVVVSLRPTVEL